MKSSKYILWAVAFLLLFSGCDNKIKIDGVPSLEVSTIGTTFKVGEPVIFQFTGNADIVSFYSGETYREYEYRSGRVIDAGEIFLSFATWQNNGQAPTTLQLYISTDFNGDYSSFENIENATWVEMRDRFEWATGTGTTLRPSGVVSISDLIDVEKHFYLAFRYAYQTTRVRRTWSIQNLTLTTQTEMFGIQDLITQPEVGFTKIDKFPEAPHTITFSRQDWQMNINGPGTNPGYDTEAWYVTTGIWPGIVDKGPDRAVAIKGITDIAEDFIYIYDEPGVYKVTFVAANVSIDETAEVIKELVITIVDDEP